MESIGSLHLEAGESDLFHLMSVVRFRGEGRIKGCYCFNWQELDIVGGVECMYRDNWRSTGAMVKQDFNVYISQWLETNNFTLHVSILSLWLKEDHQIFGRSLIAVAYYSAISLCNEREKKAKPSTGASLF